MRKSLDLPGFTLRIKRDKTCQPMFCSDYNSRQKSHGGENKLDDSDQDCSQKPVFVELPLEVALAAAKFAGLAAVRLLSVSDVRVER